MEYVSEISCVKSHAIIVFLCCCSFLVNTSASIAVFVSVDSGGVSVFVSIDSGGVSIFISVGPW